MEEGRGKGKWEGRDRAWDGKGKGGRGGKGRKGATAPPPTLIPGAATGPCLYHVACQLLRCWRFRRACHVELPTIEDHSFTTNVDFHLNLDRSIDTVRRRQWRTFDSMTSLRTCVNLSCYVIHLLTAIVWLLATTAHRRRVLINVRRWWLSSHVLKARLHGMIDSATKPKSRLVA